MVRRVAHLQRVVGNACASGGAAARRRPPPPPPRSTLSFAPPGRHRSPWTRSGARPARTNCWSSIWLLLDVTTPAFCVVLARGKVRRPRSWWPAMYCRPSPWPCQIVALAQITTRWRWYVARTVLPACFVASVLDGVHRVAVVGDPRWRHVAPGSMNGNSSRT